MKISFSICMTLTIALAVQPLSVSTTSAQDTRREDLDHERRLRDDFRKEQWRKNFDVEPYVRGQDKNKDGVLAPEEIEGKRTRQFLEKIGIPTDKSSKIDDLVKNYNTRIANEAEKKRKAFQDRISTLDPFGAPADSVGVDQFGVEKSDEGLQTFDETASGMKASDFAPEALKDADKLLDTFDRDKNGFLDGDEISRLSWRSPSPESSDLNRDGRLSKMELAKRFSTRLATTQKRGAESKKKTTNAKAVSPATGESRSRSDGSKDRERDSQYGRRDSSRGSSGNAVAKAKANAKSSKAYAKYVDRLYKKYDSNSNGTLDKKELAASSLLRKVRDEDGDGLISKQEVIALVAGGKSRNRKALSPTSSSASKKSKRSKRSKSRRELPEAHSTANASASQRSSLTDIDVDADGQIQMHEFSDTWTAEKLKEFRDKDKNGDGLLSPAEWHGKARNDRRDGGR